MKKMRMMRKELLPCQMRVAAGKGEQGWSPWSSAWLGAASSDSVAALSWLSQVLACAASDCLFPSDLHLFRVAAPCLHHSRSVVRRSGWVSYEWCGNRILDCLNEILFRLDLQQAAVYTDLHAAGIAALCSCSKRTTECAICLLKVADAAVLLCHSKRPGSKTFPSQLQVCAYSSRGRKAWLHL